jgi:neutral ceramidase
MSTQLTSAKVSITPTLAANPFMGGYAVQTDARVATSGTPYAPLYARCVVLWQDDQPHAIVTLDVLAIPTAMRQRLSGRLTALASWAESDIVVTATHTHNGPALEASLDPYICYNLSDLSQVQAYTAWLEDTVVNLVTTALNANREDVTLDYASTTQNLSLNRAGFSTVETAVPVLAARRGDGTVAAVVFGYGTHPTAAGMRTLFDGDYPAGACAYVEKARSKCFAICLTGAAGDQNPNGGTAGWALRDSMAASLGSAVDTRLRTVGRALAGIGATSINDAAVPFDISTSASSLAAFRSAYAKRINDPNGWASYYSRHGEVMASWIDTNDVPTSHPLPIQVWRLPGDGASAQLRIAFIGGEAVSGYAATLRSTYGGVNGIIINSYANEVACYVPTDAFFPPSYTGGSYEGGWDVDNPAIAGGAMCAYGHLAHFRPGKGGIQETVLAELNSQLK